MSNKVEQRKNLDAYLGLVEKVKQEPEVFEWITNGWLKTQ